LDVKDRIAPGAVLECYLTSNDEIAPVHQWQFCPFTSKNIPK
jgi:hypothetical protein